MNCDQAQRALDIAFDEGDVLETHVAAHVLECKVCGEYHRDLSALDAALRFAPPVQPAPALVARIQAKIADQPRHRPRPYAYPVMAAAAVLLLAGIGGQVADWFPVTRGGAMEAWMPQEPLLPEWAFMKQELLGIPAAVAGDMASFSQALEARWDSLTVWQASSGGMHSPWLWVMFLACIVAACALDGMEFMSRRVNRLGR